MVLLGKRAEVFAVGVVVLVVKISTTGSGQAGGPAHYHTVSFLYLLYQTMDLFAIRQRLFVSQLIRRTAGSIDMIVPGIIHLGLHDQIIIEVHCHHSFQVDVIFILTSNHLSILLCHCQYVVIMKITSKQKGDQTMKYHTKLEGMLLQRYDGLIFRNSSIWDKNSSKREIQNLLAGLY